MACITTMQRYEIKYLLGAREKEAVLQAMSPYMELDEYGRTTIRNVYFDTDSFRLIRRSLEKPAYKEKLRIRSYQPARPDDPVFVELKKKYQSVVYKRRVVLPKQEALQSFRENTPLPLQSQIADEIEYFRSYYSPLRPTAFLSYEREAFRMTDGSDFRVTFDENILCRNRDFSLGSEIYGVSLLPEGCTLMELKTPGGLPLWLTSVLTRFHIYQTSFSKYGTAYQKFLYQSVRGGPFHD